MRAARTLLARIAATFGAIVDGPDGGRPARVFPGAATLAATSEGELAQVGIPKARARTIHALARAVVDGGLELRPGADVEATMDKLVSLPGVGTWTAQYIAMRALGWPDAFLATDLGVLKALGETRPARALARSEAWRPWRAYAVIHLWRKQR